MEQEEYDTWGPEYVVKVYNPNIHLVGFLVIDNTVLGPGKGGIRMIQNVDEEEVRRLARAMTWKNALAGIPFGGAKSGIVWEGGTEAAKKICIQGFAKAIKIFTPKKYIAAPDVNTGEKEMQWFVEATGNWRSATGKPANYCMQVFGSKGEKCGIPHEFGSTGFGVAHATKVAADLIGLSLDGATVAIHGFGNVGSFTAKYLKDMGAEIVAVATKEGATYKNKRISQEDFWKVPVDILIPASVTDVINETNKNDIKAKLIVEGANIPMQETIEDELFKRDILIVPDIVANAGGVISSYAEYRGYNPKRMFDTVEKKITESTKRVLKESLKRKMNPRKVALEIAQRIVENKRKKQRHDV